MLARQYRRRAPLITLLLIVVGFFLIISGYPPLGFLGAALILLSIVVPWLTLGIKPDPPGWNREADRARRAAEQSGAAPVEAEPPAAEAEPGTAARRRDLPDRQGSQRATDSA